MTLVGLDFDNTLVQYDNLFHKMAIKSGLIDKTVPVDKKEIREFMHRKGKNHEFTLMQGQVYGKEILQAKQSDGMKETLIELHRKGVRIKIISHKTQFPYKGPKYDLRKAAMRWLEENELISEENTGLTKNDIYFESSLENKLRRIKTLGCTHYVDDLEEVVNNIDGNIKRIHYNPKGAAANYKKSVQSANTWDQVKNIILNGNEAR